MQTPTAAMLNFVFRHIVAPDQDTLSKFNALMAFQYTFFPKIQDGRQILQAVEIGSVITPSGRYCACAEWPQMAIYNYLTHFLVFKQPALDLDDTRTLTVIL